MKGDARRPRDTPEGRAEYNPNDEMNRDRQPGGLGQEGLKFGNDVQLYKINRTCHAF